MNENSDDTPCLTSTGTGFAETLSERGVAIIDLGDAGRALCDRVVKETDGFFTEGVKRVQDAWRRSAAVREIALLPQIQRAIDSAYGRRSFPFQTLNFKWGSEQHLHSDAIHFNSDPDGFMCGVWIALEDVEPDAGPLTYLAGSHRLPLFTMQEAGVNGSPNQYDYKRTYVHALADQTAVKNLGPESAILKKGQALVWAANLIHGGSPIRRTEATRRSVVVHMYFDDCVYYTPMTSQMAIRQLSLRLPADVRSGGVRWPRRNGRIVWPPAKWLLRTYLDNFTKKVYLYR